MLCLPVDIDPRARLSIVVNLTSFVPTARPEKRIDVVLSVRLQIRIIYLIALFVFRLNEVELSAFGRDK